jgi:ArsR family transcriptional regulator, arsenate/arsenite/antimonite-responsive transcriptional repressor
MKCCDDKKISKELKKTADFLRIIAEENRVRILCMLKNEPRCVCEIWPELDLPQNLTSHHLGVLKDAGLVKSEKKGLKVFYQVDKDNLKKQLNNLNLFLRNSN